MSIKKSKKNRLLNSFNLCLIVMVVVGGLYFLKSMDDLIVKNLELEQLKVNLDLLQEEKQEMEFLRNNLESYESINSRLENLNMVKVATIDYVNVGDDSLAKK